MADLDSFEPPAERLRRSDGNTGPQDALPSLAGEVRLSSGSTVPQGKRKRDLSWEALVDETAASIPAERGKVNAALRDIRQAMGGEEDEIVAREIRHRARLYRLLWRDIALTPTALAKNWERVALDASKKPEQGVNLVAISDCGICGGDHFLERIEPDGREVMVPCPECGPSLATL